MSKETNLFLLTVLHLINLGKCNSLVKDNKVNTDHNTLVDNSLNASIINLLSPNTSSLIDKEIKSQTVQLEQKDDSDCKKTGKFLNFTIEDVNYEGGLITAACELLQEPYRVRTDIDLPEEDILIFRKLYPVWDPIVVETKSSEEPLILTDYLKKGRGDEGRKLARVKHAKIDPLVRASYSGYFTVNEKYNSNLFFWFFPAQNDDTIPCLKTDEIKDTPVILWLQGGPGVSSMFGLFHEIGPLAFDSQERLTLNNFTWNKEYSLLFIDNPVGTGFSFTNDTDGLSTTQEEIGENLYKALVQFFQLFYEYQGSPFYIAGESYAGKHIPSVAYEIMKNNPQAGIFINLKGLAIGNGFTDPENMMGYSDFLIKLGIIDQESYHLMQIIEKQAKYNMRHKKFLHAFLDWTRMLLVFLKSSSYKNMYHVMEEREIDQLDVFSSFVQEPSIRRALHVGDTEFTSIGQVYGTLIPDMMRSVKPQVDELLKEYRIMFYSGQLDLIVAYPLTHEGMFRDVSWGTRKFLKVKDRVAGYAASSGNLTMVLVRNAGHMVPADQPEWAYNIIQAFINNQI